jgi:hypothetical protein
VGEPASFSNDAILANADILVVADDFVPKGINQHDSFCSPGTLPVLSTGVLGLSG